MQEWLACLASIESYWKNVRADGRRQKGEKTEEYMLCDTGLHHGQINTFVFLLSLLNYLTQRHAIFETEVLFFVAVFFDWLLFSPYLKIG